MGTTADSWLHHFGQTTQKALKLELQLQRKESLGSRKLMQMYMGQSWLNRKLAKYKNKQQAAQLRAHELKSYGMTVRGLLPSSDSAWLWE